MRTKILQSEISLDKDVKMELFDNVKIGHENLSYFHHHLSLGKKYCKMNFKKVRKLKKIAIILERSLIFNKIFTNRA